MNPLRKVIGHLYNCKEATRVISQAQDRPLSTFEAWKLRMHLTVCDACTRFSQHIRFLREALQRYRS